MEEQMNNVGRAMETLRENKREALETEITATEIKNALDRLIGRPDTSEDGIRECEDISVETSKIKKQRKKEKE